MPRNLMMKNSNPGNCHFLKRAWKNFKNSIAANTRFLDCIQIEVTSACFAKCIYCPHTTMKHTWKARHLDKITFEKLLPLLQRSRQAHLQGWGEPFLHPDIFKFIEVAKKAGCKVSSTTSGQQIDADIAVKIVQSGLHTLAFSLTGTADRSNDARIGTDFEKVCEGIKILSKTRRLHNSGIRIHLAYLLLADRVEALHELPELLGDLDVDMAVISTLDYIAKPEHVNLAFFPDEIEKIEYAKQILQKISIRANKYGKKIYFSLPEAKSRAQKGCRENIGKSLYMDALGNISPCIYLNVPGNTLEQKTKIFGNVHASSPEQIWKENNYQQFRAKHISGAPDMVCIDCVKRYEC